MVDYDIRWEAKIYSLSVAWQTEVLELNKKWYHKDFRVGILRILGQSIKHTVYNALLISYSVSSEYKTHQTEKVQPFH